MDVQIARFRSDGLQHFPMRVKFEFEVGDAYQWN